MPLLQLLRKPRVPRQSPLPVPAKICHILTAPLEIRFPIYAQIAESSFLPEQHYRNYRSLFLSCKQICQEMQQECLRVAPVILESLQKHAGLESLVKLQPLLPPNFASLNHLTIGMPTWALFNPDTQAYVLEAIMPVLQMHLSSLTIGLEDIENELGALTLGNCLTTRQLGKFLDAYDYVRDQNSDDKEDYYNIRTTYTGVVGFASRMNCLIAPHLCEDKHDKTNQICLRAGLLVPPPVIPCNVRQIVFRLKKLHNETLCGCGKLPHHIYPYHSKSLRWNPVLELGQLWRKGWDMSWYNEKGKVHWSSKRDPAMFVWKQVDNKYVSRKQ